MTKLSTTREVISALGGPTDLAAALGFKVQRVSNWNGWDFFPANTFIPIQALLAERGFSAPPSLWGPLVAELRGDPSRPAEGAAA